MSCHGMDSLAQSCKNVLLHTRIGMTHMVLEAVAVTEEGECSSATTIGPVLLTPNGLSSCPHRRWRRRWRHERRRSGATQ